MNGGAARPPLPSTTGSSRGTLKRRAGLLALLALAAVASALLLRAAPLGDRDPLATTLAILPLTIAGLVVIEVLARARGSIRPAAGPLCLKIGLLSMWILLALVRTRLALPLTAPAMAAALFLLLLLHAVDLLVRLRPVLPAAAGHTPSSLFFLLPLLLYWSFAPWATEQRPPDGDEPWYLLVTHSLAFDFDVDLANNYAGEDWKPFLDRPLEPQPGDPRGANGEIYSRHNALLPLFLAPAYRLFGLAGAIATMGLLSAALSWLVLRLARRYFPDAAGPSILAYGCFSLSPPLLLYSHQIWTEVPAALLLCLGLDQIRQQDRSPRRLGFSLAALILLLLLLKLRFVLLAGSLLLVALGRLYPHRLRYLALVGFFAAAALVLLVLNEQLYGNALKIHSWQELAFYRQRPLEVASHLLGLLFDPAYGLVASAPLWLLLVPATLLCCRRYRGLIGDVLVLSAPYLVIVAGRSEWYGGWSPPFRYAMPLLPLFTLLLVPLLRLRRRPFFKPLVAVLLLLTVVLTVVWLAVPGWTYNFAHGRTHLTDHLERQTGLDFARFLPSAVRPRTATWIWPPLLVLVSLLTLIPRPRRPLGPSATAVALSLLLFAVAGLPLLARRLPTHVVECESPWVEHHGGHASPEPWVYDRTRFRDSWVLRQGENLQAHLTAGGRSLSLELQVLPIQHHPQPIAVELLSDGRFLASLELFDRDDWQQHSLGPFSWTPGSTLEVRVGPSPTAPPLNGVAFDRLVLHWQR